MSLTKRMLYAAAAVLLIVATASSASGLPLAEATPSAEQLRQKVAAAEAEAVSLRKALSAARERMFTAEAEAQRAAAELSRVEHRLATGRQRSANLARDVDRAEDRLENERGRLRRARKNLAERLVAIYVAGPTGAGEVAMGAAGYNEFLVGASYMAAIENADGQLAERVEEVRRRVAAELANLKQQRIEAKRHEALLAADRDRVGAIKNAADARAAELRGAAAARDLALADLLGKMEVWAKQVERAERRERRLAEAEAQRSGEEAVERWLGGPYSIPTAIVMCESGGNYRALNPSSGAGGAYQIMPETWAAYGGEGLPHLASKQEQDRIAALIWADSGPTPWVCKA